MMTFPTIREEFIRVALNDHKRHRTGLLHSIVQRVLATNTPRRPHDSKRVQPPRGMSSVR